MKLTGIGQLCNHLNRQNPRPMGTLHIRRRISYVPDIFSEENPLSDNTRYIGAGSGLSLSASVAPTIAPKFFVHPRNFASSRNSWPFLLLTMPRKIPADLKEANISGTPSNMLMVSRWLDWMADEKISAASPTCHQKSSGKLSRIERRTLDLVFSKLHRSCPIVTKVKLSAV